MTYEFIEMFITHSLNQKSKVTKSLLLIVIYDLHSKDLKKKQQNKVKEQQKLKQIKQSLGGVL